MNNSEFNYDGQAILQLCASPEKHSFTDKSGKVVEWYVCKMTKKDSSIIFPIPAKIDSGVSELKAGHVVKFAFNVRLKNITAVSSNGSYLKPYTDFVIVKVLDSKLA